VRKANWKSPNEVKKNFGSASIIANNRIVFNIKGNQYRLVTAVDYKRQIIYIRFVGTHRQYDGVNSEEI
jgi:mRNA interferase HigB